MKTSVIIVNYNTKDLLEKCLTNLVDIDSTLELIVADNGSKDGSAEMVKTKFPKAILVECGGNSGLASGSNRGLERATGDYILYLGSDAFPEKNTISGMVEYMEANSQVGLATCKLVTRSGKLDMDAHRGFPTPWAAITHFSKLNKLFPKSKIFNQYFLGHKNLNEPHEIDLCISHFMLIKRAVFEKVGKWDETYFVYGEDVDFCYRVKQAGYKIMYLPQWKALHYKGATVGIRKETQDIKNAATTSKETRAKMRRETTKAMRIFYNTHYKNKYPWFVRAFVLSGISFLGFFRNLRA